MLNLRFKVGREEVKSKGKGVLSRENDTYKYPEGKRRHTAWREVESSLRCSGDWSARGWDCHFCLYTETQLHSQSHPSSGSLWKCAERLKQVFPFLKETSIRSLWPVTRGVLLPRQLKVGASRADLGLSDKCLRHVTILTSKDSSCRSLAFLLSSTLLYF